MDRLLDMERLITTFDPVYEVLKASRKQYGTGVYLGGAFIRGTVFQEATFHMA